ncbi:MAG: hypothetical protein ABIP79_02105 [Chitinophagaceae bacterium]
MTIFNAAKTISSLLSSIKKQHRFIATELGEILTAAKKSNDGSLDASDFKKITHYYGLAVPAILGDSICALRGFNMTRKERLSLTYQGAMTGLFDDFFDKFNMPDEQVKEFMEKPEELIGENSAERLFFIFYKNALLNAHDPVLVSRYLGQVYQAQIESKKQSTPGLSQKEILDITLKKGGVSVLFYRASMSHSFVEGEENALNNMGGLMQFGNDIFDIYKDHNSNIETIPTTAKRIADVRQLFTDQMNKSFDLTKQLSYEAKNKKKHLSLVAMSLCSRCFVCLDQLKINESATDSVFMPKEYTREQLVCDMDKRKNKIKTISYFLKQCI